MKLCHCHVIMHSLNADWPICLSCFAWMQEQPAGQHLATFLMVDRIYKPCTLPIMVSTIAAGAGGGTTHSSAARHPMLKHLGLYALFPLPIPGRATHPCEPPPAAVQQKDIISEDDIFTALEKIHTEKAGGGGAAAESGAADEGSVTPLIRRTIATYMAAKALVGVATPGYDELQRVVVTPGNAPTGYVYFIPQDAHLETEVVTRSFMEGHMVVRPVLPHIPWPPPPSERPAPCPSSPCTHHCTELCYV